MAREILNPYVAGNPLQTSHVFYGRDDIFGSIIRRLSGKSQDNPILLYGQKRTGKTSILFQIKNDQSRLGPRYLPVYINLQGMDVTRRGMGAFLYNIACEICQAIGIDQPEQDKLLDNPDVFFRHTFLTRVRASIGDQHLLLLLDEYETLGERVKAKTLEEGIFPFLRTWMAEDPSVSFIFAGSHRPSELKPNYEVAFGRTLLQVIEVGFLERDAAIRLITEPVEGLMHYHCDAVEAVFRLTSGYPFFIQLLCQNLFSWYALEMECSQEGEIVEVTGKDIEAILDEATAIGDNQLREIWIDYSLTEQVVLVGVSRALDSVKATTTAVPYVSRADIDNVLQRFSSTLKKDKVTRTLQGLVERDTLRLDRDSSQYRFTVDLLRKWIHESQDLRELAESLQPAVEEPISLEEDSGSSREAGLTRAVAKVATPIVLILIAACGAVWRFRDPLFGLWPPAAVSPTPIPTLVTMMTSTGTPEPMTPPATDEPTSTPTETPTSTPTEIQTSTPTEILPSTPTDAPTSAPTPQPVVQPVLVSPDMGATLQNPVAFRWTGKLWVGQAYQVTALHRESGVTVQSALLTVDTGELDLPEALYGEWRWWVSVVRDQRELVSASDWFFFFDPHPGPDPPPDPEH